MKARISMLTVLVLTCALAALPAPVLATPPEPLVITADLWMTGADSAAGTFATSGLLSSAGQASEVFFVADGTIHGVKTLAGAEGSSFTIRFQARMTWTSPTTAVALGRYVIVAGTGAYEGLHGVGESYAEIDLLTHHIEATYTGNAHLD